MDVISGEVETISGDFDTVSRDSGLEMTVSDNSEEGMSVGMVVSGVVVAMGLWVGMVVLKGSVVSEGVDVLKKN